MKKRFACLAITCLYLAVYFSAAAQSVPVTKTNPMKVYMHYMPWFDAPINPVAGTNYNWGYHWKMNTKNPNIIDANGQRQIASHYYPLIGPYASKDPDVIEYHLLLMKLSGIDGVLIDWYGQTGSNGDINSLLTNSNALINKSASAGINFALILEDRFWRNTTDGKNAMTYAKNNYFNKSNYIIEDAAAGPFVGIFGPVTFQSQNQWTEILAAAEQPVEFITLDNHSNLPGSNADGEYMWVYNSFLNGLNNFYTNKAPGLNHAIGGAYPRFNDYYSQGGAGNTLFNISDNNGKTFDTTLALAKKYKNNISSLQLITWNDFGEGTQIEPTVQNGFRDLVKIQEFTGVPYTQTDLEAVYRLYTLRKKYVGDASKQTQLNQVFAYFTNLQINEAVALMDRVENINANAALVSVTSAGSPSENGATGSFVFSATNVSADVIVKYTLSGTATAADYNGTPALSGTITLTVANPSVTVTVNATDDAVVDPKETIILTIAEDTSYRIVKSSASLLIADNETPPCGESMIINTTVAPVIDGAPDEIWSKAVANDITKTVNGTIQSDYAAHWKAMYDNDYLYVLVQVKDSALKKDGPQGWQSDAVEIFIDGKNEKNGAYDNNDFQYAFRWGIEPALNTMYGVGNRTGIVYAIPTVDGGYNLEVKIPWSTLNSGAPVNGKEIGFDVEVNDNDKDRNRQAIAGWFASSSNAYNNPSVFGTAELTICTGETIAAPPAILNIDSVTGVKDSLFNFAIIASNTPTQFEAISLPEGLTLNTITGLITGTPVQWGDFTTQITVTNNSGTATQALKIIIADRYPARFLSAGAVYADTVMVVNWSADSTVFVSGYELEHSSDSSNFTKIHSITSSVNNNDTVPYTATDIAPGTGNNYYRIKARLWNGETVYSDIVKAPPVIDPGTATTLLKLYPNPVSDGQLHLTFAAGAKDKLKIRLANFIGQSVYTTELNINAGISTYTLPVPLKLSAGYYSIEFITEKGTRIIRKLLIN